MGPPMGATVAALLKRAVGGERVIDLLFHLPEGYLDRRARPTLKEALHSAKPGQVATLSIEVVRHEPPANPRQPWRVVVTDGTGFAELVFFHFTRADLMATGSETAGIRQAGALRQPDHHAAPGLRGAGDAARPHS